MEFRRASGILGAAFISFGLAACGGGPDIDKAKADFANPSGKTSDKNGVIAAQGKQDASGSAMQLGAGGLPGNSFGLSATGKSGFAKASVARLMAPQAERLRALVQRDQYRSFGLTTAQDDSSCGDAEASAIFGEDLAADAADGEVSGSGSFTIDYSSCNIGLTGSADYSIEYEITQTSMKFTIEVSMNNVCQEDECVTGAMAMEMSAEGGLGAAGTFQIITAWDLTSTHEGKEIKSKGGIKMGFDDQGTSTIEILVYVNTADGEEWSYVLKATQDFDGAGSLEIRGSDGELSCTWSADGSGQCTGDAGALEWSAEESDAVEGEEWFAEG